MKAITQGCYFSNYKTRICNDLKGNFIRNIRATCFGEGFNGRIEIFSFLKLPERRLLLCEIQGPKTVVDLNT